MFHAHVSVGLLSPAGPQQGLPSAPHVFPGGTRGQGSFREEAEGPSCQWKWALSVSSPGASQCLCLTTGCQWHRDRTGCAVPETLCDEALAW